MVKCVSAVLLTKNKNKHRFSKCTNNEALWKLDTVVCFKARRVQSFNGSEIQHAIHQFKSSLSPGFTLSSGLDGVRQVLWTLMSGGF